MTLVPFPRLDPELPPQPTAAAAPQPAAALPLEEFRSGAIGALLARVEALIKAAPDDLLRRVDSGVGEAGRRRPLELMQRLDLERPRLLRAFAHALERGFKPLAQRAPIDVEADHLVPIRSEDVDEQAALTALATRAGPHLPPVAQLLRDRLQHAVRALGVDIAPHALTPASLCEAWRRALVAVEFDYDQRLLLHELFDRHVLQRLGPMYQTALDLLDRQGWPQADVGAPLVVDERSLEALRRAETTSDAAADAALARRLLEAIEDRREPIVQRVALVGQLFNDVLADPQLPAGFAPLFEPLRFAVIKAALADAGFLGSGNHPLRQRLMQAASLGVCARLGGALALRQMDSLLLSLRMQTDLAAHLALGALDALAPLTPGDVLHFTESLRDEAALRRETLLTRVRRIVAQELEAQALGQRVPPAAQELVETGLGSLLAVRLLRFGIDHRMWHDAVDRLGQVLHSLQARHEAGAVRAELLEVLRIDLADTGLSRARIDALLEGLQETYATLERASPRERPLDGPRVLPISASPRVPASDEALLRSVLLVGHWFRVFGAGGDETLWLRLAAWLPEHDEVRFASFDGSRTYAVAQRTLLDDLRAGRTEPIGPTADMHAALQAWRGR